MLNSFSSKIQSLIAKIINEFKLCLYSTQQISLGLYCCVCCSNTEMLPMFRCWCQKDDHWILHSMAAWTLPWKQGAATVTGQMLSPTLASTHMHGIY